MEQTISIFRNRLYLIITCAIFLFLFIWCPLNYILSEAGIIKTEDIRNYKDPEKFYESGVFSGILNEIEKGKAGLENLYTNYLPMYGEIVIFLKTSDTDMQVPFVELLEYFDKPESKQTDSIKINDINDSDENDINPDIISETSVSVSIIDQLKFDTMMVENDGLHRYYAIYPSGGENIDFIDSLIDTALSFPEDILRANMEIQIEHINRISAATSKSGANFYLYVGKRMQDAEYFTKIVPDEISTALYFNEFMDRIEGTKGKGALNVDTFEKRMENIFRTDHHWSALGAYSGYCDIINMINKVSPEIGEPIPLNGLITYDEVRMRGSASRISSFSRIEEKFSVMDIDLPEPDSKYKVRNNAASYANGTFNKGRFADHYSEYYSIGSRYVYPKNNTGRNLLIIGDSFTWWSAWLIAANFDETYVYFPWDRKKLNYDDYIWENNITDVVCMLFSDRILFNIYNDCPLENIRTD